MSSATQPVAIDRSPESPFESVRHATGRACWECRWLLVAIGAQLAFSAIVCGLAHEPMLAGPIDAYATILGALVVFGGMALVGELFQRRLVEARSRGALGAYVAACRGLRRELLTPEYLAAVILIFATAPLALSAFSAAKQAIPALNPFAWDSRLVAWGSVLDGGRPLWERLQPTLGRPQITVILDLFYHRAWPTLLLATFVWAGISKNDRASQRFLVSFVLVFFVVGNVLALAMSSAGPPYLGYLSLDSSQGFSSLFDYLRSVDARSPLLSVRGEAVLWTAYTRHLEGLGFGVSAMPSVHVGSAVLVALFGFTVSRPVGICLSIVALFTFISSVALGWHYALDGYVAALVAWGIWWFAGRLTRSPRP
jgi:PAP2 superfamily protein